MNNERIDLTQFKDIPKQMEIKWHEHPTYGARYLIKVSEPETPWVVGAVVPDFEPHDDYAKNKIEQEKMAKLFAKTPELIAELKKMYKREDALVSAIKELCDSEDSTGCSGDLTVVSLDPMLKLYELTSE